MHYNYDFLHGYLLTLKCSDPVRYEESDEAYALLSCIDKEFPEEKKEFISELKEVDWADKRIFHQFFPLTKCKVKTKDDYGKLSKVYQKELKITGGLIRFPQTISVINKSVFESWIKKITSDRKCILLVDFLMRNCRKLFEASDSLYTAYENLCAQLIHDFEKTEALFEKIHTSQLMTMYFLDNMMLLDEQRTASFKNFNGAKMLSHILHKHPDLMKIALNEKRRAKLLAQYVGNLARKGVYNLSDTALADKLVRMEGNKSTIRRNIGDGRQGHPDKLAQAIDNYFALEFEKVS